MIKLLDILKENQENQIYYHGSDKQFDKIQSFVSEFDNGISGVFLSPSIDFAKRWGKIIYKFRIKTNNIFDYENPQHLKQYYDFLAKEYSKDIPNLTGEDVKKFYNFSFAFLKFNKQKFLKYIKEYKKNPLQYIKKDEFGDIIDDNLPLIKKAISYAIEQMLEYPDKITNTISHINRNKILYKDYYSIETNSNTIYKMGFDGCYIWERNIKNVMIFNVKNIDIIK